MADRPTDLLNATVSGEITKARNIGQVVCVVQEVLEMIFSFICSTGKATFKNQKLPDLLNSI